MGFKFGSWIGTSSSSPSVWKVGGATASMGTLRRSVEERRIQELQLAGRDDVCGPFD